MNRRQFFASIILALSVFAVQGRTSSDPQAPTSKTAARQPPQTVIYALGASLFYQDLDGSPAREEKIALPEDAKIQFVSGSRDGKMLAFAAGQTIYFYDTQTKSLSPVVPQDRATYLYPSISPDGQKVSCRASRTVATLCTLSRDGAVSDFGLTTKGATKSRWTPDGQTIYFANGPDLMRIPVEGGEAERVVRGYYIEHFSINAQGLIVTPVPVDNTNVKPGLIDEAGQITTLPFETNSFHNPTWNREGTSIAFSLRARYGGEANAQGIYIWKDIQTGKETRKVSDAQSNAESGFIWR